ncbi:MAG: hypothetical protein ABI921_13140 [Panacibacter sp.]
MLIICQTVSTDIFNYFCRLGKTHGGFIVSGLMNKFINVQECDARGDAIKNLSPAQKKLI